MKIKFILLLFSITFGSNLNIITWNIENYPKSGQETIDAVREIIEYLNPDIIALQEISSQYYFENLIDDLDGWDGVRQGDGTHSLAYIYKTNNPALVILDSYDIYENEWYSFPRSPMILSVYFEGNYIKFINNHFKCCSGSENEERRRQASLYIEQYIDGYLDDQNVIVLGDLNDNITDPEDDNVFINFIDNESEFQFVDMEIAEGSSYYWSYPSYPSHIDHILITNELFDEFVNNNSQTNTILAEEIATNNWNQYDNIISDHRPVQLLLEFDQISYIGDTNSDQNIDVLDVVNIIDIILNNSNPNQIEIYLSDYNSDGLVDVSDIVAIVNYILS